MTDFKFGKETVLRVHDADNVQWAQAVLEETYRNYTGNSPFVGSLQQVDSDPNVRTGPPALIEGIIDVSGSMKEEISGECKLDIAKLLMLNTINRWISVSDNNGHMRANPIGARTTFLLRLLGQSSQTDSPCHATELVIPPGRLREIEHYKSVVDKILSLKAGGATPLAFSLFMAGNDLSNTYRNYPGTRDIFYISDGVATGCGGDPIVAAERVRNNPHSPTTIHTVSLGLGGNITAKTVLGQIATPGRYRNSENLAENTKGAPPPGQNVFGTYNSGKYVFPSPGKSYGELQATTSLDGKVLWPKRTP